MKSLAKRGDKGLELPAMLTETSLTLPPRTTFEQWEELIGTLERIGKAHQWWLGDALNQGEARYGEKYAQALDATEFDYGTLANYAWVAGRVEFSFRNENLSWKHHSVVATFDDPEPQAYWLARAEAEEWSAAVLRKEIKRAYLTEQGSVGDTYRVLYADPPWEYGSSGLDSYGPAERHYPTVPTDDLCDLVVDGRSVDQLVESDAVLFLWATSPLLPDALRLIEAWGFEYKSSFVWDKVRHNFGHYNSVRHEFLLIATRGSCVPDADDLVLHDSVVTVERSSEHSEKPEKFREIVDGLYPNGSRLELFARGETPEGWDTWGAT